YGGLDEVVVVNLSQLVLYFDPANRIHIPESRTFGVASSASHIRVQHQIYFPTPDIRVSRDPVVCISHVSYNDNDDSLEKWVVLDQSQMELWRKRGFVPDSDEEEELDG